VSYLVKNHFASTSNYNKLSTSFMSGPARKIIASGGNAVRAFVAQVNMGLLLAYSSGGAPLSACAAAPAPQEELRGGGRRSASRCR
jgi:hypothetical protein